jgi:hypothetical protein
MTGPPGATLVGPNPRLRRDEIVSLPGPVLRATNLVRQRSRKGNRDDILVAAVAMLWGVLLIFGSAMAGVQPGMIDGGGPMIADPLGTDLGQERLLRTSPLVPVPPLCGI